jgi:Domain of unknown function (DUF4124)
MRRIVIALTAFTGFIAVAQADVYKTVDSQGQVHYSDQWSAGAELIKRDGTRTLAASPGPAPTQAPATNDRGVSDSAKAAATKQVQADVSTLRAEQCKQLKDQYDKMIHARRIYQSTPDSSGPRQYLTDAEADAERVKTRQEMDDACAAAAGN